ncbi:MAG: pantoate--beta-alanine ligase [Gemmatimonadaceae bacterium]
MLRVTTVASLRGALAEARGKGSSIGFVPTMGALHRGHISLIERARRDADIVVVSIFVNPRQFGPKEDFERYPRPIEDDERIAEECGADVLFAPDVAEIYPATPIVTISAGSVASRLEGKVRPGHFDGVLTVVAKLFNIVRPEFAVFGQKDLQQAALVGAMVRDLNMPLSIVVSPTVREQDGLALSSRNRFLSSAGRQSALGLSRALAAASGAYGEGERDPGELEAAGRAVLAADQRVVVDYFTVIDRRTFEPVAGDAGEEWAVVTAARVGTTRLIDNVLLGETSAD